MENKTEKEMYIDSLKLIRNAMERKILSRLQIDDSIATGIVPLDDVNSMILTYFEITDKINSKE